MAPSNYASTSSSTPLNRSPSKPKLNGRTSSSESSSNRTKILLLGLRRAGKTSIQQVLFNNLPPKQTFYLETTMRITKIPIDTIIPLEIWDCPANITVETLGAPLSQFSTIIFVIDIRDLYNQAISKLVDFIVACYTDNPDIALEVFVHKAEKLQEDDKIENFRQIHERVSDRLLDISSDYEQMQLNFHLTSVYDHSLHEAFSRVLQKLIDSLPYLEDLLNVFCANSQSPKAFLFDTRSTLYVATDASPVDSATHNLCCDYLQMLNAFGPLYKSITINPRRTSPPEPLIPSPSLPRTPPPSAVTPHPFSQEKVKQDAPSLSRIDSRSSGLLSPTLPPTPTRSKTPSTNGTNGSSHTPNTRSNGGSLSPTAPSYRPSSTSTPNKNDDDEPPPVIPNSTKKPKELFYPSASTTLSLPSSAPPPASVGGAVYVPPPTGGTSGSGLNSGSTTVTYHLITKRLALLALVPTNVFLEKRGLLEYNVVFFREGVQEICDVEEEMRNDV